MKQNKYKKSYKNSNKFNYNILTKYMSLKNMNKNMQNNSSKIEIYKL